MKNGYIKVNMHIFALRDKIHAHTCMHGQSAGRNIIKIHF